MMIVASGALREMDLLPMVSADQLAFEPLDEINAGSEAAWWAGVGAGVVTGLIILAACTS